MPRRWKRSGQAGETVAKLDGQALAADGMVAPVSATTTKCGGRDDCRYGSDNKAAVPKETMAAVAANKEEDNHIW
jgi:hypothetical protein